MGEIWTLEHVNRRSCHRHNNDHTNHWAIEEYIYKAINRILYICKARRTKMENVCHVGWGRPGSASVHSRVPYSDNQTMSRDRWQLSFVVAGGSDCMWIILYLWCCSPKHHHFCIAIIGRAVLPASLIPLVEMLYLVIGTNLQDRISIAQKLTKLLILTLVRLAVGAFY